MKQIIGWILLIVSGAIGSIGVLLIRLSKPELTNTQLFLNYWALWVGVSVSLISGFFLAELNKNMHKI